MQVEASTCTAVSCWPSTKMMRALVRLYRLNAYFCDVGHSKAGRVGLRCFLMVESKRLSETDTRETPMRALLGTSIAAVVAVTVWWSLPTHATQQYNDVSINALGMMVTTTNLPRDPVYDQGTVFLSPEAQAQYTQ
jgi:hypothetical protein